MQTVIESYIAQLKMMVFKSSYREVAQKIGVNQTTLWRFLNNQSKRNSFDLNTLIKLEKQNILIPKTNAAYQATPWNLYHYNKWKEKQIGVFKNGK